MKHGVQNLKIILLGIVTLILLVLLVMQLIPKQTSDLQIKEEISVSSSLIGVVQGGYSSQLTGTVENVGEDPVRMLAIRVTVSNGDAEKTVELPGGTVAAYGERRIFYTEDGTQSWTRVKDVTVVLANGEALHLQNPASTASLGGLVWLCIALLAVSVCFLVHACMVRYYMHEEDLMVQESTEQEA